MSPKRKSAWEKLEEAISEASKIWCQARLKGEAEIWDRSHPAAQHLDKLIWKQQQTRLRSIRRLKTMDQNKLIARYKTYMQKVGLRHLTEEDFRKYRELLSHFRQHPNPEITRLQDLDVSLVRAIQKRVSDKANPPVRVRYSAYAKDASGLPVDNLDEVAVTGKVVFVADRYPIPYRSPIVENPTWLQVALFANEMIQICETPEHTYLESIHVHREVDSIKEVHFGMGS